MAETIFLVRHGESESNEGRYFDGWGDSRLTSLGREQARLLRKRLQKEGMGRVFCSESARARETLSLLGMKCPAAYSKDLRERGYGELEGVCWADDKEKYERMHVDPHFCSKGGESCGQVQKRVWDYFRSKVFPAKEEKVLVVSHHGPLVLLACKLLGVPLSRWRVLRLGNCGLCILTREDGLWRIKLWNSLSHYGLLNYSPLYSRKGKAR